MYMEDGIQRRPSSAMVRRSRVPDGRADGAGKRLLTGESLFMTVFQNKVSDKRKVAFAAPYPGKIIAVHLAEIGGELIAQKDSFLAAAKGSRSASLSSVGWGRLLRRRGFIMQRLQGDGFAFVHAGGTLSSGRSRRGSCCGRYGLSLAFQPSWITTSRQWADQVCALRR